MFSDHIFGSIRYSFLLYQIHNNLLLVDGFFNIFLSQKYCEKVKFFENDDAFLV